MYTFDTMLSIHFPEPEFKFQLIGGKEQIWDAYRKKWVRLTPEEWVRQNFIQYLIKNKNYPASLISVEKEIVLGELNKRYDIAVFKEAKPWLLVECKEPNVSLTPEVLQQVLRYNTIVLAPFVVVTNGKHHFAWCFNNGEMLAINNLPDW